jgi:two-component system, OmpR family, sensor kinase
MFRSIRWRLQAWYALILLAVLVAIAVILDWQVSRFSWREFNMTLADAALQLERQLRPPPPPGERFFDREPPLGPPPDFDEFGPSGPDRPFSRRRQPPPREPQLPAVIDLGLPSRDRPYYTIWRRDGSVLRSSLEEPGHAPDLEAFGPPSQPKLVQSGEYRSAMLLGLRGTRILVAQSTTRLQNELSSLRWQLAAAGGIVLLVGLGGGWLVASWTLRPIEVISATASSITARTLTGRIDDQKVPSELTELAQILNAMFARLQTAFEQQTRFTADASHELRTPLAVMRTHVESALRQPRTPEEYRETLDVCLQSIQRMGNLVQGLLTLARVDAGKLDLRLTVIDLKPLAAECVQLLEPLAAEKHVNITTQFRPATVLGDPSQLTQVVTNLLANAIQYNRTGGSVDVKLDCDQSAATLSVQDTGPGIPSEARSRLFERFFRIDEARARTTGGNGLGLAICKSIVQAHQGEIGCELGPDTIGAVFWIRLPLLQKSSSSRRNLKLART